MLTPEYQSTVSSLSLLAWPTSQYDYYGVAIRNMEPERVSSSLASVGVEELIHTTGCTTLHTRQTKQAM